MAQLALTDDPIFTKHDVRQTKIIRDAIRQEREAANAMFGTAVVFAALATGGAIWLFPDADLVVYLIVFIIVFVIGAVPAIDA